MWRFSLLVPVENLKAPAAAVPFNTVNEDSAEPPRRETPWEVKFALQLTFPSKVAVPSPPNRILLEPFSLKITEPLSNPAPLEPALPINTLE